MNLFIDEQPYDVSADSAGAADGLTMQGVIDRISTAVRASDRIIVSVAQNGVDLDEAAITAVLDRPVAALGRIDFWTRPMRDVATEIFDNAVALFDSTEPQTAEASRLLSAGQNVAAMELLGANIRSWQTGHDASMQAIAFLDLDADESALNRFREMLGEIRDTLRDRDYVSLSDLLQYEAPDAVGGWRNALDALRSEIDSM